jgi:hypothetical protein
MQHSSAPSHAYMCIKFIFLSFATGPADSAVQLSGPASVKPIWVLIGSLRSGIVAVVIIASHRTMLVLSEGDPNVVPGCTHDVPVTTRTQHNSSRISISVPGTVSPGKLHKFDGASRRPQTSSIPAGHFAGQMANDVASQCLPGQHPGGCTSVPQVVPKLLELCPGKLPSGRFLGSGTFSFCS